MTKNKYDVSTDNMALQDGKLHTKQSQDVDPTLKSIQLLKDSGQALSKDTKHVARVPQILFMQWGQEDAGDPKAYLQGRHNRDPELARKLAARLNSNEFKAFRLWDGKIASSDIIKEGNKIAL